MRLMIIALLTILGVPLVGGSLKHHPASARPYALPWQWNAQERIADRLNLSKIGERTKAYSTDHDRPVGPRLSSDSTETADSALVTYVIDGRRNPELLLPHELFDGLMSGLTPDLALREKQRDFYRGALRSAGIDDIELWDRLESVAGEYLLTCPPFSYQGE